MKDSRRIIWLSSYPKSGNTWIRIFLENICSGSNQAADINQLSLSKIASSRVLFDKIAGVNSSDLNEIEIDRYRPKVYRQLALESDQDIVLKVHDAWRLNHDQQELFPADITKSVIYVMRNPLDIVVSNAFHNSIDYHVSAERLNSNHILCNESDRLYNQLRQELYSWSKHVESWIDQSGLRLIVVRYEDLIEDPMNHFTRILSFLNWSHNDKEVVKAIKNSELSVLQKQERKQGFREKPLHAKSFFRLGKAGAWKEELDNDLVQTIYTSNKKIMDRFGYSAKNLHI